jgi:hypothetical protein
MSKKPLPPLDLLRTLLSYDPATGEFKWIGRLGTKAVIGSVAGTVSPKGYRVIFVKGQGYMAHRLAWLFITGSEPEDQIDHINGNRDDNRACNLRSVNNAVNCRNKAQPTRNNKSGIRGVHERNGKYVAAIGFEGRKMVLGNYRTAEHAGEAYALAKRVLHFLGLAS